MIYLFEYGGYSSSQTEDRIQGFFSIAQNPAKETFFPSAALLFRCSAMSPLASSATLNIAPKSVIAGTDTQGEWLSANGGKPFDILAACLRTRVAGTAALSSISRTKGSNADLSSVRIQRGANGAIYVATSAKAIAVAGFVGGQTVNAAGVSLTFPAFGDNFAGLALASMDDKPITRSKRLLLTVVGKAENLDMGWNPNRTSVGSHWGHGPAQAEGIPATVTIGNALVKRVWALDEAGARASHLPFKAQGGAATFLIGPADKTVWYEIGE